MIQPRWSSLLESCANTLSGFGISLAINAVLLPALGFPVTLQQNVIVVSVFTVVSIARNYAWRRAFCWLHRWDRSTAGIGRNEK